MRSNRLMSALVLPVALGALLSAAGAQGQGKGESKPEKAEARGGVQQGRGGEQGRGSQQPVVKQNKPERASMGRLQRPSDDRGRGNASKGPEGADKGPIVREVAGDVERRSFRTLSLSPKRGERLAGLAVARANKRGIAENTFLITPVANRVQVLNSAGMLLLDLDDDRDIGNWRVVTVPFRDAKGAPSFCRSGEGHPVWGRQWCIDKGFGVGEMDDVRWARVLDIGDVRIRPRTEAELTRDVLLDVLGDVVFNRLASHAITLGLVEPLAGRWIGEPAGPRVLLLTSGGRPVAEIVDVDRDDRAEVLVVAVRR